MDVKSAFVEVAYPGGRTACWSPQDGFSGDPEVVNIAFELSGNGVFIPVPGLYPVQADGTTAIGALAALCAYSPADVTIIHLDDRVVEALDADESEGELDDP